MKTTLTVALATVVPGGFIILAAIFLWHALARRAGALHPLPVLTAPVALQFGRHRIQ
ncbi:MAG TPA: hypothetical protein VNK52_04360 [Hyphomicrobiaceae bacterium]|nr:hypothetical protein [Hyphomicrobiaceae bacterium]